MANDNTGAEFGPQEGQIETIDANAPAPTFYIEERIVEKVIDTHQEEQEDGSFLTFAEEDEHETVRLFGPFVKAIADREEESVKTRFKALALPGQQTVTVIAAEDIDGKSESAPAAAQEPVVTDVLKPDAPKSDEVGGTQTDVSTGVTSDDAPSWSVTQADVPESDQADATGTTNPAADVPAAAPVEVPQAIVDGDGSTPNTVDAITGSSTEADDTTVDPTAPPVAPTSPSVPDGPADGVVDQSAGTVQATEPTIDTPATIPVESTQGDSGASQIDAENPVTGEATTEATGDTSGTINSATPVDAPVVDATPGDGAPADAVQNVTSATAGDVQPVTSETDATAAPSAQPATVDGPDDSLVNSAPAEQATPGQG